LVVTETAEKDEITC